MTATCINLIERFGSKYRVSFEEGYSPRNVPRDKLDAWMMEIRGRFGVIHPHGGDTLAVMVDRHPAARRALAAMPCCRLAQDGEHEATFLFDVADFATVAAIVKPNRKAQWSETRRQDARDRMNALNSPKAMA